MPGHWQDVFKQTDSRSGKKNAASILLTKVHHRSDYFNHLIQLLSKGVIKEVLSHFSI